MYRLLVFPLTLSVVLASCAWPPPESVPESEMPHYNIVVTEIGYYKDEALLNFKYHLETGSPGYEWISENYEGTREFGIVKWITAPDESNFSVASRKNLVYLRDGITLILPMSISFDTEKLAYLFKEDEHYDYDIAFAKVSIKPESLAITRKD